MTCAFSGHRPQRLPWQFDETDPRCAALKLRMAQEIQSLAEQGTDTFLCGMALGCDLYFAEEVLKLAAQYPIALWAVLPYAGQNLHWSARDRARQAALCAQAARVFALEPAYTEGCMLRRNRWMVDRADRLLTVYDGGPGGTAATVRYAKQSGVDVIPIWL